MRSMKLTGCFLVNWLMLMSCHQCIGWSRRKYSQFTNNFFIGQHFHVSYSSAKVTIKQNAAQFHAY